MSVCCLLAVFIATPAQTPVIVMPLAPKGKPDAGIVAAINRELPGAIAEKLSVIGDKAAKKAARETPAAATTRCGANAACLGSYGRAARADRVVFGLATQDGKDVSVDFSLIACLEGASIHRVTVVFTAGSDVMKTLQENMPRLLGTESSEMPALQALAPLKKKKETVASEPILPPAQDTPALAPIVPLAPREKRSRAILWTGVGVAAAGALGMAAFAYFGSAALAIARTDGPTVPQTVAVANEARGNTDVVYANIAAGAGGALLAVGAALIITDLVFESKTKTSVSISTTGASVHWGFAW